MASSSTTVPIAHVPVACTYPPAAERTHATRRSGSDNAVHDVPCSSTYTSRAAARNGSRRSRSRTQVRPAHHLIEVGGLPQQVELDDRVGRRVVRRQPDRSGRPDRAHHGGHQRAVAGDVGGPPEMVEREHLQSVALQDRAGGERVAGRGDGLIEPQGEGDGGMVLQVCRRSPGCRSPTAGGARGCGSLRRPGRRDRRR